MTGAANRASVLDLLAREAVLCDLRAQDAWEVIEALAKRLRSRGDVTAGFAAATIAREKEFPTGLPTEPFPVAIPHPDPRDAIRSSIAVAILHSPVEFATMGDPQTPLPVEMVFLLAIADPSEQVQTLQELVMLLQDRAFLLDARQAQTAEAFMDIARSRSRSGRNEEKGGEP
jgi:PTS system galactitol-specific IIA component